MNHKQPTRNFTIVLPDDLYAQVAALAQDQDRSMSNMMVFLIRQSIARSNALQAGGFRTTWRDIPQ